MRRLCLWLRIKRKRKNRKRKDTVRYFWTDEELRMMAVSERVGMAFARASCTMREAADAAIIFGSAGYSLDE